LASSFCRGESVLRSIELFGSQVAPALRDDA